MQDAAETGHESLVEPGRALVATDLEESVHHAGVVLRLPRPAAPADRLLLQTQPAQRALCTLGKARSNKTATTEVDRCPRLPSKECGAVVTGRNNINTIFKWSL